MDEFQVVESVKRVVLYTWYCVLFDCSTKKNVKTRGKKIASVTASSNEQPVNVKVVTAEVIAGRTADNEPWYF